MVGAISVSDGRPRVNYRRLKKSVRQPVTLLLSNSAKWGCANGQQPGHQNSGRPHSAGAMTPGLDRGRHQLGGVLREVALVCEPGREV